MVFCSGVAILSVLRTLHGKCLPLFVLSTSQCEPALVIPHHGVRPSVWHCRLRAKKMCKDGQGALGRHGRKPELIKRKVKDRWASPSHHNQKRA